MIYGHSMFTFFFQFSVIIVLRFFLELSDFIYCTVNNNIVT